MSSHHMYWTSPDVFGDRLVGLDDRSARLLAADCAARLLPLWEERYPGDERPRAAIQAARDYAYGLIDEHVLARAREDAEDALLSTEEHEDATFAAYAASAAYYAASRDAHVAAYFAAICGRLALGERAAAWQSRRILEYALAASAGGTHAVRGVRDSALL